MKECFGNYYDTELCKIRYNCPEESECFTKTSTEKGLCNCKYKSNCTLLRQETQSFLRNENNVSVEECPFCKMF